MLDYHIRYI